MDLFEQFAAYCQDMSADGLEALTGLIEIVEKEVPGSFSDAPYYGELMTALELLSEATGSLWEHVPNVTMDVDIAK